MDIKNLNGSFRDNLGSLIAAHKPKLVMFGCLVIAFATGFALGNYESLGSQTTKRQLNYTTKQTSEPKPSITPKPTSKANNIQPATSNPQCKIKGNIASGGKKTYHIPGGAFYDRTNAEVCFNTEVEAEAAGFSKSSR